MVASFGLQTGANVKYLNAALVVAVCGAGALVGTLIGSWLGVRGATVYRAK